MIKEFLFNSFSAAFIWLAIGVWKLRDTLLNTDSEMTNSPLQPFLSGIFASIGSIVLGIIIFVLKIKELLH